MLCSFSDSGNRVRRQQQVRVRRVVCLETKTGVAWRRVQTGRGVVSDFGGNDDVRLGDSCEGRRWAGVVTFGSFKGALLRGLFAQRNLM